MTDTTDIAALREAAMKATPGPWSVARDGSVISNQYHPLATVSEGFHRLRSDGETGKDAEFIALANPATILAILDQIEGERQRADYAVKVKDNDEQTALYWAKIASEALAENVALKGDQVPVAYTDKLSLETLQGNGMACMWKQGQGAEWREQIALFIAPQKPVVDYFSSLVAMGLIAAEKAMRKHPQPNYVLLKVAEEAGEVVQAGVHYAEGRMTWSELEGEVIQLIAMLNRLMVEGDQVNGIKPPQAIEAAGGIVKDSE